MQHCKNNVMWKDINRITVEFKGQQVKFLIQQKEHINRITVEFKGHVYTRARIFVTSY